MEPLNRKLLLQPDVKPDFRHPPPPPPPVPSSTSSSSYDYLPSEFLNIPGDPTDDSSTTATVVVILAVLLLFALFSIYMCRLGNQSRSLQSRSRPTQPSPSPAPPQRVELYVIKSLPVFSFRENAKYQSDCAICLCEYEENERVKLIPFCQHVYHPQCIDTWLSSHVSCPICRSTWFFKFDERGDSGMSPVVSEGVSHSE